ncbi:MAG: VCBS repeat-containing protein [Myxococcales bacterium]|nr:VCBS repeat-containing protein [Myxococcales bacterium]
MTIRSKSYHSSLKAWLGVALAGAALSACANLGTIERGECGNGVVEPEAGEECDSFPEGNCAPRGTDNQCRYLCTAPGSAAGTDPINCPAGFGCGTDGVCRRASGSYTPGSVLRQGYTLRVESGDFDGDGQSEVVSVTPTELGIHFLDERGNQQAQTDVSGAAIVPAIGQLTGDDLSDLVVLRSELGGGLNVLRGRKDGTLQPTAYSPFDVGTGDAEVVILDAMETRHTVGGEVLNIKGDEILMLADDFMFSATDTVDLLLTLPGPVADLAGHPAVGNLDENKLRSPCQELALAYHGANSVWVYTPCVREGASLKWNKYSSDETSPPKRQLPPVKLPQGRTISTGVLLADFNGDHHLDMLIGAEPNGSTKCDGDSELFAAFGVGDGTFHSDLSTLPLADGDGNAISLGNTLVCSMPLAVGNLNDDAAIDLVMGSQILVSDPDSQASGPLGGATYTIATVNFEGKWTSAVVADLNANGIPDVATATQGSNTIDFYNGVGDGRLNRFQVQARGEPSELTVGDFDGDLVNDLAFKERGPHGNVGAGVETGDSLSIAFGNGFGGPSEPVSMGRLARIDRVVSGNVEELFSDGIADLLVLSTSENSDSRSIALLTGSSDRQLVSPFFLASDGSTLPVRAVIGEFTGDDHNDVAVLASSTESFETSTFTNRVWILPSTGEAAIDSADVFSSEPVETLESGENALTAALDLDGDGVDELIAFVSGTSDSGAVMIIGHVVDGGFQLEEPQFTDESYFFDPLGNVTGGPDPGVPDPAPMPGEPATTGAYVVYNGQILVRDVDGDGRKDILALGLATAGDDGIPEPKIVFYKNEGNGTLDVSKRVVFENPADIDPGSFALTQGDTDSAPEVVLLGAEGGWIADFDFGQKKLMNPRALAGVRGGNSVVSSDYNGDGVMDLAIAGEGGVQVFLGKAVIE